MSNINNTKLKEKYENTKDNLFFDITISTGTYRIASAYEFYLDAIHTTVPQELQGKEITKEVFSQYSREIKITDENLKYYGYSIAKDGGEYIYTSIENNIDILEHKVPLSNEYIDFIKENFLNIDDVFDISILPFKDKTHLFININYTTPYKHNTYAVTDLTTKSIKFLNDKLYYMPRINLKENVIILTNESDFLRVDYCVFDQNGNFITKYRG